LTELAGSAGNPADLLTDTIVTGPNPDWPCGVWPCS
jgi:hypothetical protein